MASGQPLAVERPDESRFVVEIDGELAELAYRRVGTRLILDHTGVPDAIGGRGVGGLLVRAAVDRATAEGLTIVPKCRYAAQWLRRHPDVSDGLRIEW